MPLHKLLFMDVSIALGLLLSLFNNFMVPNHKSVFLKLYQHIRLILQLLCVLHLRGYGHP
jgi:hypothetical protein